MDKPFKTVDEQVGILESRGLEIPDKETAAQALLSCNYYTIINGYKDLFIDAEASGRAHEDRYAEGTTFTHFQLIYALDRGFRSATLDTLIQAESVMKTSLVHAFCEKFGGGDSYLTADWECGEEFYRGPKDKYSDSLGRLKDNLKKLRKNSRRKDYIQHYIDNYDSVPLWVLSPCLTFGDAATFYDFQGDTVQNLTCSRVARASGKAQISPRKMREAYQILTPFRNTCAHNERVFCARLGVRGQYRMKDLFAALAIVLPGNAVAQYARHIRYYLNAIDDEAIRAKVLNGMKMSYEELDELATT